MYVVCMSVCMSVCMHACMHACMYKYIYTYVWVNQNISLTLNVPFGDDSSVCLKMVYPHGH